MSVHPVCPTVRPSHLACFDCSSKVWWKVQFVNLVAVKFPSRLRHVLPFSLHTATLCTGLL